MSARFGQPGYKSTWKPKGRITRTNPPKRPLADRFWEKVDKNGPEFEDRGPCWLWTSSKTSNGYGQIYSHEPGDPMAITAHRASLRVHGIGVPDGLVADHMCRRRLCVNPAHLRFVTIKTNGLENNDSPFARNSRKTHCGSCGKPLAGENLALVPVTKKKTFRGNPLPKPVTKRYRYCLTCYPHNWRHAVVPRPRPPGSFYKPTDPDYDQR